VRFQGDLVEDADCSLDGVDRELFLFGRYVARVAYSFFKDPLDRGVVTLVRAVVVENDESPINSATPASSRGLPSHIPREGAGARNTPASFIRLLAAVP